jgi:hypothetical protein
MQCYYTLASASGQPANLSAQHESAILDSTFSRFCVTIGQELTGVQEGHNPWPQLWAAMNLQPYVSTCSSAYPPPSDTAMDQIKSQPAHGHGSNSGLEGNRLFSHFRPPRPQTEVKQNPPYPLLLSSSFPAVHHQKRQQGTENGLRSHTRAGVVLVLLLYVPPAP